MQPSAFWQWQEPQVGVITLFQTNESSMDQLLTADDVAKLLKVSRRKFEYMVKGGEAPPFIRLGKLRRWEPTAVKTWLQKRRADYAAKPDN
jgi:excisionase family DNA binding protein